MKNGLFALIFVLAPLLSFAQNGSVSFGVNTGSAPSQSPVPKNTSTSNSATTSMGFDNSANQPAAPCHDPMDGNTFKSAKQTVADAGYEDTKLSAAKTILASNCFSSEEVIQICKLFGFEQTRLDFAKLAWSKTTDRKNYSKVSNILAYDASKKNLDNYISNGGK